MNRVFVGALLALGLAVSPALAQEKLSAQQFVEKAGQSGLAEVQLGELASEKAKATEVKTFGKRMVDDHGKANAQLKQIVEAKNMKMPAEMGAESKQMMDKLSKMSGEEFDQAYMRHMVEDHKKDVELFQGFAQQGQDQELKTFAQNTTPMLQQHLKMATDITQAEKAQVPAGQRQEGQTR